MLRLMRYMLILTIAVCATQVMADDAYYAIPLDKLELTEGKLPKVEKDLNWRSLDLWEHVRSYVVLDREGEAYVQDESPWTRGIVGDGRDRDLYQRQIAVRAPAERDITGRLFVIKSDLSGHEAVNFKIPASAADTDAKKKFLEIKSRHYQELMNRSIAGGTWFRHQMREAQKAQGRPAGEVQETPIPFRSRWNRLQDIDSTYDLFTGGQAISENLQIDRLMPVRQTGDDAVDIDSLEGITIKEIDWQPLLEGLDPKLDPLAGSVPLDQHVVFFPTFQSFMIFSDESKNIQGLFYKMAERGTEDVSTNARYEKQLCLTVSGLSRILGPNLVKSMALTGSDPYFFTGTDVAVLFEAAEPAVLEQLILAQVGMKAKAQKDTKPINGEIAGVAYKGFRSPDRSICTYIARINGVVVVANSPYQIERLAAVAKGDTKPISSLDEYKFFRSRYTLGNKGETAFFYLSDATIRRWCGPRWRIATSRRVRDAAVLAELQASHLDRLVEGNVKTGPIYTDLPIAEKGELELAPSGVISSTLGSFDFMTPIGEIPLKRVTKAEAEAYQRWREGYQRNWQWAFDPIGLRLGIENKKLSADMTVMPMIMNNQYREFINVSRGATFAADAGDLHNALGQFIIAINKDSQRVRGGQNLLQMMTSNSQMEALGWLGNYVTVYVEDDPFWDELAKAKPDDLLKFMEKNAGRVPLALQADVSSGFKLTAFLVSFRAFVNQTAPNMTNWETLTYKDQPYVKITPTESARSQEEHLENMAVYYTASGDSLLVTLREDMLKKSIDRRLAIEEAKKKGEKPPKIEHPWLGQNVALTVDNKLIQVAAVLMSRWQSPSPMQAASWNNLPILNEWKRRYPNEDPVKLHARFWNVNLTDPGGGNYVWNEKWQTMESTVYGHPGEPKDGSLLHPFYQFLDRADFGLTFEEQGLRAKATLTK